MAQDGGLGEDAADDLALAAGEAVANAIAHGSTVESRVYVSCTLVRDGVEVVVGDEGGGFPVESVVRDALASPPEPSAEHGRGIPLMAMLSDRCSFEVRTVGTIVVLFKSFVGCSSDGQLAIEARSPRSVSVRHAAHLEGKEPNDNDS